MQFQAVASLAELLSVLPADAALPYQENQKWLETLLGAPRIELRRESAILFANIYARAPEDNVVAALSPLFATAKKRWARLAMGSVAGVRGTAPACHGSSVSRSSPRPPACSSLGAVSQAPEAHGALLAVAFTMALHPSAVETELGQSSLRLLLDATKESDDRVAVAACKVSAVACYREQSSIVKVACITNTRTHLQTLY